MRTTPIRVSFRRIAKSIASHWFPCIVLGTLLWRVQLAQAQQPTVPAATAQTPPVATLRNTVRRVFVDVVVTDHKGKPVPGLTKDDFQVSEDGVAQAVRSFDAHALKPSTAERAEAPLNLPPNTFVNLVRAPLDSPLTVILYDVLNTPLASLPYAHEAVVRFIKQQHSSTRVAIFVLGGELRMLQGFTDDETRLMNALNSKAAGSQQSMQLQLNTDTSAAQADIAADLPAGATDILGNLKSLENTEATMLQQERLEMTVEAFAEVARFVSALPGRKSLIWLSGSFPSSVLPNSDPTMSGTANEFGDAYNFAAKVKEAEDLLNLNHVAVYPVDARGLEVNPQFSAANNAKVAPNSRPPIAANVNNNAEHSTMDSVAEDTGGHAFYNTNGLEQAMQSALEDGANYYTLTYAPSNAKSDGSERKIAVKLRLAGYQLSYRHSYFADDAGHPAPTATTTAADQERNLLLDRAMQHGAPISSELLFVTGVYPAGGAMPATPKEMDDLSRFQAADGKARKKESAAPLQVQHYQIDYAIQGKQLDLPDAPDGKYATNMTYAVAAFLPDSQLAAGLEASVKNEIPSAQMQKIRAQGFHAKLNFVVPVQATALRIAVRDNIGKKMGTIEVPLPISAPKLPADAGKP